MLVDNWYSYVRMSSFLGVDFFRIVNEGLVDDWAQVYAKVSFDKQELLNKGALFGVLRIKGREDLVNKSAEIFVWLDEFFNKTSKGGNLKEMVDGLIEKNEVLESAWCWVMIDKETGERLVKSTSTNGGKAVIVRGDQEVVLSGGQGGVVVGSLKTGDRLGLGVGGMVNKFNSLGKKKNLKIISDELNKEVEGEEDRAVAGLLLEIKKKNDEVVIEEEEIATYEITEDKSEVEEMASANKAVGPDGIKKKLLGLKIGVYEKTRKKRALWLAGIFLVLFAVSVIGGLVKGKNKSAVEGWQTELSSWQKREDEAKGLVKINPAGARKLLLEVKQEVEKAGDVWKGTKFEKKWGDYKTKLDESWIEVSGERKVEPKLFLVLNLIRPNLVGDRIVSLGKEVGLLDFGEGLAVKINLGDKKADVVGSDKEKRWRAIGGDEKQLVFLTDKGLSLSDNKGGLEFDATVSGPIEIEVFGGGIYVLDAGVGEIWKFNLAGGEIQDRRRWLGPGQEIGINEVTDMDIDGDIWVLAKNGQVAKLRRGNKERFGLTGSPEKLVGDRVAVQIEGEKLAILDTNGSRVVVFNKGTGEYEYQLVGEVFGKAKDIMYAEDGKLMVLSEGKMSWLE